MVSLTGELTQALRELFPDYHFREETFPDVDDFINLAPHHGIARIERADNVIPFRAPLPDAPNTATARRFSP